MTSIGKALEEIMERTMAEALIEQDRKRGKKHSETQVKREVVRETFPYKL